MTADSDCDISVISMAAYYFHIKNVQSLGPIVCHKLAIPFIPVVNLSDRCEIYPFQNNFFLGEKRVFPSVGVCM